MPASPLFSLELRRFDLWRLGVGALLLFALVVGTVWLAAVRDEPWFLLAVAATAAALLAAASLLRVRPARLRWDGQTWALGEHPGKIVVALDAGAWMLLRFRRTGPGSGLRTTWLPAQRRGLERDWHALRCAVYFPRPASGGPAAADPASAPE